MLWIKRRKEEGAWKRRARFGSVQLPDVLQVTAQGGNSMCKRMLGMSGDAGEILVGLEVQEMLTFHFPPAPRSRLLPPEGDVFS